MHECFPKHMRMGIARTDKEENKEAEEDKKDKETDVRMPIAVAQAYRPIGSQLLEAAFYF